MTPDLHDLLPGHDLRARVSALGAELSRDLGAVVEAIPGAPNGPQRLAQALGLDKVSVSRLLKAMRSREPLAIVHHLPGPEPLRRFLKAAGKAGTPAPLRAHEGRQVDAFERLIRDEAGDRGALGSILSAWLPEVRREQELRARQAAFRAIGQIRGAQAEFDYSAVLLSPSVDGEGIDVVWLIGIVALQRLRPGATVKFDTRRLAPSEGARRPTDLYGNEIDGPAVRGDEFMPENPAPIEARKVGEVAHYVLGDTGFGPRSAVNVHFCEVNRSELPSAVPAGSGRRAWFYHDVKTSVKRSCFDVFVHRDLYPSADPELLIYDTALDGVADVNDPARDIDRVEGIEELSLLGAGLDRTPIAELPRYSELLDHVHATLGWDPRAFRGYRVRSEYPVYGSQITLAFRPPERE